MPNTTFRNFNPAGMPPTMGFSHVAEVTSGKLIFTAGQIPVDPTGAVVGKGDFAAQVAQCFLNLDTALKGAGADFSGVVRLTFFGVASLEFPQLMELGKVRDSYVNVAAPPTSSFVFVPRFVNPDILFEVEAIAVVPGG